MKEEETKEIKEIMELGKIEGMNEIRLLIYANIGCSNYQDELIKLFKYLSGVEEEILEDD